MTEQHFDEKEVEKREEKEEKQYQDPLSQIVGAAFLIWAGVVLLANNTGRLKTFTDLLTSLSVETYDLPFEIPFINPDAWQVFFLGGGFILLFEIIVRLLIPLYRRRVLGTVIGAIVLFALGLGTWKIVGPLILVAIGAYILLGGLFKRAR